MPSKEEVKRGGRVRLWSSQCGALLIFSLFESTQYAHLKNLCGLYPWTINLLVMCNMGGVRGGRPWGLNFISGRRKETVYLSKEMTFFDVSMAWRNNTEGHHCRKHTNLKKWTTLNMSPGLWQTTQENVLFWMLLKKKKYKEYTSGPDHRGGTKLKGWRNGHGLP